MSTGAIVSIVIGCVIAAPFILGAITIVGGLIVGLVTVIAEAITD